MAQSLKSTYAWALIAVCVSAWLALFFSLQLGFWCLAFATIGWWVWREPEEGFLLLVILAPILPMLKITQTIGTATLSKDVIIGVLFFKMWLLPLLTKRLPYRRNLMLAPLILLGVWTALAAARADSITLGILRAREIGLYALLYLGVLYLPHTKEIMQRRMKWFVATFLVTLLLAAYQWFFAVDSAVLRFDPARSVWIPRISSILAHPSIYGEYLIAASTLFLAGMAASVRWRRQFAVLVAATLPAMYLTYSRAVWIGMAAGAGAMGVLWVWRRTTSSGLRPTSPSKGEVPLLTKERSPRFGGAGEVLKQWRWIVGIPAGIVLFLGLPLTPAGTFLRSAFDPTYASNAERLEFMVRLVAPLTNAEALIGRGLGDVTAQQFRQVDIGVQDIAEGRSRAVQLTKDATLVDNQWLKSFVEMGLFGLIIYFWLFWRYAKGCLELLRKHKSQSTNSRAVFGLWGAGFLAAFIVQGFFIDIWDIFPTNAMFWIIGALVSASLTPHPRNPV